MGSGDSRPLHSAVTTVRVSQCIRDNFLRTIFALFRIYPASCQERMKQCVSHLICTRGKENTLVPLFLESLHVFLPGFYAPDCSFCHFLLVKTEYRVLIEGLWF